MRRFESCPHSQERRGRLLVEGPSPTKRCSRVRSSTPVPTFRSDCAPMAEEIQASLFFFRRRTTATCILCARAIHAGSSPARRSMPRSSNGRTKVFEAFYAGSIPALGAKLVLAWCTVHRRTYKPLRSRLEHGLGSTPSASTMRSKLMGMSSRFLIGRQLVRFQPDAPIFGTVAEW
jgi:hypothetical protein